MKKVLIPVLALAMVSLLASCGGGTNSSSTSGSQSSSLKNKDKPLIWWNRQPSDPTTGAIDTDAMNFNDSTYYVGFDAAGGGAVQGKMITDYLASKTIAELDKNSDGTLGYVLCIGDSGHNDSIARTKGIRSALKTLKNDSAAAADSQEGTVTVKDGTLKVVELAAKEMKSDAGATWDASTATNSVSGWVTQFAKQLDMFVSNNDGMAMGCLSSSSYPKGTPIFGYDANKDALASIKGGEGLTGTVSQNVDAQASSVLMVIRNLLDGVTGDDVHTKGFNKVADKYGNIITPSVDYVAASKAVLAQNSAVTASNVDSYYNASKDIRDSGIKQINGTSKKVLLTIYNSGDNFLSSSYKPALQYYAPLMNLDITYVEGDGQSETAVLDKFANLGNYDAYAINMVKTNSGADYTNKLKA